MLLNCSEEEVLLTPSLRADKKASLSLYSACRYLNDRGFNCDVYLNDGDLNCNVPHMTAKYIPPNSILGLDAVYASTASACIGHAVIFREILNGECIVSDPGCRIHRKLLKGERIYSILHPYNKPNRLKLNLFYILDSISNNIQYYIYIPEYLVNKVSKAISFVFSFYLLCSLVYILAL